MLALLRYDSNAYPACLSIQALQLPPLFKIPPRKFIEGSYYEPEIADTPETWTDIQDPQV